MGLGCSLNNIWGLGRGGLRSDGTGLPEHPAEGARQHGLRLRLGFRFRERREVDEGLRSAARPEPDRGLGARRAVAARCARQLRAEEPAADAGLGLGRGRGVARSESAAASLELESG